MYGVMVQNLGSLLYDAMLTFSNIDPLTFQFYKVALGLTWVCSFSYRSLCFRQQQGKQSQIFT